jgi:hypothetical protein
MAKSTDESSEPPPERAKSSRQSPTQKGHADRERERNENDIGVPPRHGSPLFAAQLSAPLETKSPADEG